MNESAKAFTKRKIHWMAQFLHLKQLDEVKTIEDIDVDLKLSSLKPWHAHWIKEFYDYLTSENGGEIISNEWKAAFSTEAIEKGTEALEHLDPFLPLIR